MMLNQDLTNIPHPKASQLTIARSKRGEGSPRHRAEKNELKLLKTIARHGFISSKVAKFLMADKNNRVLKRLHKQEMLVEILLSHPIYTVSYGTEGRVFLLTESGLLHLQNLAGCSFQYPELDTSKIKHLQLSHASEMLIAITHLFNKGVLVEYQIESEVSKKDSMGQKRFDAVFWNKEGNLYGLEIERTAKSGRAFCDTRMRILTALSRRDRDKLVYSGVYYFIHESISKQYKLGFSAGSSVFRWEKNTQNKYINTGVATKIPSLEASKIEFFPLVDLSKKGGAR